MGRKPDNSNHQLKAMSAYLEYYKGSHQDFAKSIDISKSHLTNILMGRKKASLLVCNKIMMQTRGDIVLKDLRPDLHAEILAFVER